MVIKGFQQRDGVDFGDVFSPVVRYSTVRIILALCAHYGLYKRHLDCPKAFAQADLDTTCYCKAPPGMKLPHGKCFEVLKSIYGLRQASRLFHQLLSTFLLSIGFTMHVAETCLFYKITETDLAIILVYVDDLLLCTLTDIFADELIELLKEKFNVTDLGEITWCLGMRVLTSEDRHTVSIDLERYLTDVLVRYDFDALQSVATPMLHNVHLTSADCPTTDAEHAEMEKYPYRSAISSLMFAMVVMRFDLSFAVISCARFSANPGLPHWLALVRIFQYVKGTKGLRLTYTKMNDGPPLLYGMSDADWATSDVDDRRSVIGHCFYLCGGIILWHTQFWKVCLSIFEGEFGAMTEAAKNALASRHLLEYLPMTIATEVKDNPTTILTDSLSTQQVAYNPKHHSRTKHFQIREKWLQGLVNEDLLRVQHFLRVDNNSDFFVKAHPTKTFREMRNKLSGPFQKLQIILSNGEILRKRQRQEQLDEDFKEDSV